MDARKQRKELLVACADGDDGAGASQATGGSSPIAGKVRYLYRYRVNVPTCTGYLT
jgi:hypothetical protein